MFMPVKIAICPDKYLALFTPTSILQSLIVDFENQKNVCYHIPDFTIGGNNEVIFGNTAVR